jgi:hypothetical protein
MLAFYFIYNDYEFIDTSSTTTTKLHDSLLHLSSSKLLNSNEWTEFTITNDDKTLFSVDKTTGMTTIESLTVTNELQGALIDSLKARIAALEVIFECIY